MHGSESRRRRIGRAVLMARGLTYAAGGTILVFAGLGDSSLGLAILGYHAVQVVVSFALLRNPPEPSTTWAVVDVLTPSLLGLLVGHDPRSMHMLVAAQVAASFLSPRPRYAAIVGIAGVAGMAAGIALDDVVVTSIDLSPRGYAIAETGAVTAGIVLGIAMMTILGKAAWRTRRRLIAMADAQRKEAQLKTRFMSTVSHELRTPLTAIRGYAALLAESSEDEAQRQEFIEAIHTQSEHLSRLVDDVLDLLRLDAGRVSVSLEPVSVAEVARAVVATVAVRDGQVIDQLVARDAVVVADVDRLFQVVRNVVENAVKYGGDHVVVSASDSGDEQTLIEIADDGQGIPEDRVDEIFSEFVRLDDPGAQPASGFGLGLSIVRRLVEAMGGRIDYRQGRGGGACFVITLASAAAASERPSPPGRDHVRVEAGVVQASVPSGVLDLEASVLNDL